MRCWGFTHTRQTLYPSSCIPSLVALFIFSVIRLWWIAKSGIKASRTANPSNDRNVWRRQLPDSRDYAPSCTIFTLLIEVPLAAFLRVETMQLKLALNSWLSMSGMLLLQMCVFTSHSTDWLFFLRQGLSQPRLAWAPSTVKECPWMSVLPSAGITGMQALYLV